MNPSALLTVAESSDYKKTSRHQEVIAFCDALAAQTSLVHRTSIGRSGEGQDIVALIVSDRKCFTPEMARRQKKVVVLVEANIHAGEVEGKESVLALARDLTVGRPSEAKPRRKDLGKIADDILAHAVLVLVPDINPDGNDRIHPRNRALDLKNLEGQVNPEGGVGTRYTGEGWNLNRDNMKQEAPETRAMAACYQAWWPHVFVDCHTTDGSIHALDLTYDVSRGNDGVFAPLREFQRAWIEKVASRVEKRHGFMSSWYGNFQVEEDPSSGWHTYPALPRFGSHYRGLLGRMDVLLETYSYLSYPRRCDVMYAWLLELFRGASKDRERILKTLAQEEQRTMERGLSPDPRVQVAIHHGVAYRGENDALLFRYPAYALDGDVIEIPSYDRESLKERVYPGRRKVKYRVPHHRSFVPTHSVSVPYAYVAPPELADRLRGHGIIFTALAEEVEMEVESYRILAMECTFSPDVASVVPLLGTGEVPLSQKPPPVRFETVLTVRPETRTLKFPAGTLWIPTAQRAGTLATYLLEPHSDDGLARWQFLDALCKVGADYPVHRCITAPHPRVKVE